jgi:hypothetical protein
MYSSGTSLKAPAMLHIINTVMDTLFFLDKISKKFKPIATWIGRLDYVTHGYPGYEVLCSVVL